MENTSLRQVLEETGEIVFPTVGTSMEPLLHERESTVLVRKKKTALKKGDVVLYIRPSGQYVLHRVIRPGRVLMVQGDHLPFAEKIREEWVIGVMEGYHAFRNSAFCSIHSGVYRRYLLLLPLRRGWITFRAQAGQIFRRWKEGKK